MKVLETGTSICSRQNRWSKTVVGPGAASQKKPEKIMPDADEPVPSVRGDKPVPRPLGPIDSYHLKPCGKAPCYCARCKGRHVRRMDIVQEHITKWPSKVGPIQHHSSLLVHCLFCHSRTLLSENALSHLHYALLIVLCSVCLEKKIQ